MSSSAYVFYSSNKTVKIPSDTDCAYKTVVPLAGHKMFFGFTSGYWLLFDILTEKVVKDGQIKGDASKHLTLFRSPKALDDKTIVFTNAGIFKLQGLNVLTGEYDAGWEFDAPTFESLPEANRTTDTKIDNAFVSFEVHLLTKTKIVGILERKENTQGNHDFLVTAYQYGKKERLAQANLASYNQPMGFANANNTDTFVLYPVTQYDKFSIHVLNVNKPDLGLQHVSLDVKMECALSYLFPWNDNSIVMFGNPDEGGTPYEVTHKLDTTKVDIKKMICNRHVPTTILDNVLAADSDKQRVLLKDNNGKYGFAVTVWNSPLNKIEFSREQDSGSNAVSSNDGSYFVEFEGGNSQKKDTINFSFNRLVSKKMFLLHFMKQAKYKGKQLVDIHGKIDVLRDVASMF